MDDGSRRPAVYLAGPEVFTPASATTGTAKKAICARHGLDGRYPGDLSMPPPGRAGAESFFGSLVEMMERCDLVIANMTPFRGVSMDAGTAFEIGFLHARGRPVFGYTNVTALYAARVKPDGMAVEPFDITENLMCVGPALLAGREIVQHDASPGELFTDLRGFEACVQQAAAHLGLGPPRSGS